MAYFAVGTERGGMNRKLKTGLKILGGLALAVGAVYTWVFVSYILDEREPWLDWRFRTGGDMHYLFEWHEPATDGVPGSVVVYNKANRDDAQCYKIQGARILAYHVPKCDELGLAISESRLTYWDWEKEGKATSGWSEGKAVNPDDGYVLFEYKWAGTPYSTSGVFTVTYPLDQQPEALQRVKNAIDACLKDDSSAEFHPSYVRVRRLEQPPDDSSDVISIDDATRPRKQRNILYNMRRLNSLLVSIDEGVDPFKCVNRAYHPRAVVTLRRVGSEWRKDAYFRVEAYAGNARNENTRKKRKDSRHD